MQSDISSEVSTDITAITIQLNELRSKFDQGMREGHEPADLKEIYLQTSSGLLTQAVGPQENLQLTIQIESKKQIKNSQLAIRITNTENIPVFTTTNSDAALSFQNIETGMHRFTVDLPAQLFVPGLYQITVAWIIPGVTQLDKVEDQVSFEIDDAKYPGHFLKDGRLGILNQTILWKHESL